MPASAFEAQGPDLRMHERDVIKYSERFFPQEDAAFFKVGRKFVCLTTDMLVAKTDVPPGMTSQQIGKKCVVQNLSDIAAMGSCPQYFVASMAFPKGYQFKNVRKIIESIDSTCKQYGVAFVGGDTNEGELSLAGFVVGLSKRVIQRNGAQAGDVACLTGDVGRVGAGFLDLKNATSTMRKKIFEPEAKVQEGKTLCANACIDISDGLSSELYAISERSRVGIYIESEKIPICKEVLKTAERFSKDAVQLALQSGEEYELLFTCSQRNLKKNDFDFSVIGSVSRGGGVFLDGKRMKRMGWEHFK